MCITQFRLNDRLYQLHKGYEWDDIEFALDSEYGCGETVRNILEDCFYTEKDLELARYDADMGNEEKQMLLQDLQEELSGLSENINKFTKDELKTKLRNLSERIFLTL